MALRQSGIEDVMDREPLPPEKTMHAELTHLSIHSLNSTPRNVIRLKGPNHATNHGVGSEARLPGTNSTRPRASPAKARLWVSRVSGTGRRLRVWAFGLKHVSIAQASILRSRGIPLAIPSFKKLTCGASCWLFPVLVSACGKASALDPRLSACKAD